MKKLDNQIEKTYYRIAAGEQISIMDIPRVFSESRKAVSDGATVEQAVRSCVLRYCQKA